MHNDTQELANAKLAFNIQCPDLEDVWLEGYDEANAGIDEMTNPYPIGTTEHEYWCEGWWCATLKEPPLFAYMVQSEDKKSFAQGFKNEFLSNSFGDLSADNDDNIHVPHWRTVLKVAGVLLLGGACAAVVADLAT